MTRARVYGLAEELTWAGCRLRSSRAAVALRGARFAELSIALAHRAHLGPHRMLRTRLRLRMPMDLTTRDPPKSSAEHLLLQMLENLDLQLLLSGNSAEQLFPSFSPVGWLGKGATGGRAIKPCKLIRLQSPSLEVRNHRKRALHSH